MKFYFHLVNAQEIIPDDEGVEVDDNLDEARTLAREAAVEMIQSGEGDFTAWRGWRAGGT